MRFHEIVINESEMDHIISDIADFIKSREGSNVKSIDLDYFYNLVKQRQPGISKNMLTAVLKKLTMVDDVTATSIQLSKETDLNTDGVEDMADHVSSIADQEAMAGIKSEL